MRAAHLDIPGSDILPAGERRVFVMPESGSICRKPNGEEAFLEIMDACRGIPPDLFGTKDQVEIDASEGRLPYRREVTLERVEKFVRAVIAHIRGRGENIIGLVGSHTITMYGAGVMLGVKQADLQPHAETGRKSSVLLVASHQPPEEERQRIEVLNHAFDVSRNPAMGGRVGALFDNTVYATPGLWRPTDARMLASRYPVLASKSISSGQWLFSRREPAHEPIGHDDFGLDHDVTTWSQNVDERPDVREAVRNNESSSAFVFKVETPRDPFEALSGTAQADLDSLGMPVVVVNNSQEKPFQRPSPIASRSRNLVDGRRLEIYEAQVLLAHTMHKLFNGAKKPLSSQDIVAAVRQEFAAYPFR